MPRVYVIIFCFPGIVSVARNSSCPAALVRANLLWKLKVFMEATCGVVVEPIGKRQKNRTERKRRVECERKIANRYILLQLKFSHFYSHFFLDP